MATVLRVAHLDINTTEGIPAGPYNAYSYAEHIQECYGTEMNEDWVVTPGAEGCTRCILEIANNDMYCYVDSDAGPTPQDDGINFLSGYHHSGFNSSEQVESWMGDAMEMLHKVGFALFVYQTEEVVYGGHQVAFPGHRAELVDIVSLIPEQKG